MSNVSSMYAIFHKLSLRHASNHSSSTTVLLFFYNITPYVYNQLAMVSVSVTLFFSLSCRVFSCACSVLRVSADWSMYHEAQWTHVRRRSAAPRTSEDRTLGRSRCADVGTAPPPTNWTSVSAMPTVCPESASLARVCHVHDATPTTTYVHARHYVYWNMNLTSHHHSHQYSFGIWPKLITTILQRREIANTTTDSGVFYKLNHFKVKEIHISFSLLF